MMSAARCFMAAAFTALSALTALAVSPHLTLMVSFSTADSQSAQAKPVQQPPSPCSAADALPLDLTGLWRGDLAKGQTQCFVLEMTLGSFARLRFGLEKGRAAGSLFAPAASTPAASSATSPIAHIYAAGMPGYQDTVLSWAAAASGNYLLRIEAAAPSQGVFVQLESLESPELYAARARALQADPRVRSLSNHMVKMNSVDPEDAEFSDLLPLRETLKGVRVVLLGEATHFDGTDFLAKSRLIRFLHSELGFDVLAFEAGIYQMSVTWDAMRSGGDPLKAFSKGANWIWSYSRQVEPIIRYASRSLSTDRPLELAGIDNQIWGEEFPRDLREFLKAKEIVTPFADPKTPESEILEDMSKVLYRSGMKKRPDKAMMVRFVDSLVRAADEAKKIEPTREVAFWQRVLANMIESTRGTELQIRDESEIGDPRDRQMAENVVWMAKEYYPDRKIIIWCHSGHAMRDHGSLPGIPYDIRVSLADGLWKAFGKEMYSIAPVSYEGRMVPRGTEVTIVSDQVQEAEFEELMAATGQTAAIVDLRQADERARWLGGSFVARPLDHKSMRSVWRNHFDSFLFLRTQKPSEMRKE